jgi:hypothetical protein
MRIIPAGIAAAAVEPVAWVEWVGASRRFALQHSSAQAGEAATKRAA